MKNSLQKMRVFIKRDFTIESSYKLAFLLGLLSSVFPILTYFFVGKFVGSDVKVEGYEADYFSFTLIGISFTTYFTLAIQTFSVSIRRAQMAGCLEAILSSQTPPGTIVAFSSIYSFISNMCILIIMFAIAHFFLGFSFSQANWLSFIVVFALSLVVFIGFGIFSAAGTVIFKQGEPFSFLFNSVSSVIGGAVFPVTLLPGWAQKIAEFFPIVHVLHAFRKTLLNDSSLIEIAPSIGILLGIATLVLPASIWFFNYAVERGKRDGTLIQY